MSDTNQDRYAGEQLNDVDTVVHLTGQDATDMPMAGQQALVEFTRLGGTYIGTGWTGYLYQQNKYFMNMTELTLFTADAFLRAANITFAANAAKKDHPVLLDIPDSATLTCTLVQGQAVKAGVTPLMTANGMVGVAATELEKGHVVQIAITGNFYDGNCVPNDFVNKVVINSANW